MNVLGKQTIRACCILGTTVRVLSTFATVAKTIGSRLNQNSYRNAIEKSKTLHEQYQRALTAAMAGGGPKGVERHVKRNKKILVRDRLKMLLDNDSEFLEVAPLAGLQMEYGDVPAAGVVTGIGKVSGRYCMVLANDATVKGGTIYPITVKKQVRAQEIAQQNRLPCVYLSDTGGGFLPLQAELFPDKEQGGRVFYNEAVMTAAGIPQIVIVCGSCTAGGAYVPTMAEEAIIVHGIGTIFLGGPPLVYAATKEVINAEDLGGATLHTSVSGCADYFAATEEEGFQQGRAVVASLNLPQPADRHTNCEPPLYDPEELTAFSDPDNIDMYEVIARIVDGSKIHEFKEKYGPNLITGFAEIHGQLVGIVGNQGYMDRPAAEKGAHFTQLCSSRNIPMIFLQNTSTNPSGQHGVDNAEDLKARAKMMATVACADTPKITFIIGRSNGPTNFAMAGRSFEPNFLFTWPSASIALDEPMRLMETMQQEIGDQETLEKLRETFTRRSSAFYSSSRVWDDGVILPQDTRQILGQCLKIVSREDKTVQVVRRPAPVIRM